METAVPGGHNACRMADRTLSSLARLRTLIVGGALLVPWIVDPFVGDSQGYKSLALAVVGGLAIVVGALQVLVGARPAATPWTDRALMLLIGWAALSLTWAANPWYGVLRVLVLLGMLGVVRGVRQSVQTSAGALHWLRLALIAGVVAALWDGAAIVQRAGGLHVSALKHASYLFVHNNMAAGYVAMLVPPALALALARRHLVGRLPALFALAVLFSYLVLLGSRAGLAVALLGLPIVVLLLLMRPLVRRLRPPGPLAGVVLIVLVTALPLSQTVRGLAKDAFYRAVETFDLELGDTAFRMLLWRKTLALVAEDPWRGVGAGNFVVEFPRFERVGEAKPHAHNDGLQVLAELGLPGLFLFLGMLYAGLVAALRVLVEAREPRVYAAGTAVFGGLLAFVVAGLVEVPFALGATGALLSVLLGLAGALDPRRRTASAANWRRGAAVLALVLGLASVAFAVRRGLASPWLARAEALAAAGRTGDALEMYGHVAGLGTGSYLPHLRRAEIMLEAGDPRDALREISQARRLWPHGPQLLDLEGRARFAVGDVDGAIDALGRAMAARPGDEARVYRLVEGLTRAGRLRDAIDLLEHQVRANPSIAHEAHLRLSVLWDQEAERRQGRERLHALAAARHYVALLIEEHAPDLEELDRRLSHLTHRLQTSAPLDEWWGVYESFLAESGASLPAPALYTSIGPEGVALFPGWEEAAGPAPPIRLR